MRGRRMQERIWPVAPRPHMRRRGRMLTLWRECAAPTREPAVIPQLLLESASMKKVVFGALAIAATATPAAYAEVQAVVDVNFANADYDIYNGYNAVHLGAAFQTAAWRAWSLQT